MLLTVLGIVNFIVLLFFGITVSASFLGIEFTRTNNMVFATFGLLIYGLQAVSYVLLGMDYASMLYPLITHLPLLLLFFFYYKQMTLPSILAIMSAYLCCQISKWFGSLALSISNEMWVMYVVRVATMIPLGYYIIKYVSPSVRLILAKSSKTIIIFGIIPFTYYIFDYIATVYTNLLYSGSQVVFEFLPFVLCIAYLIFNTVYFKEYEQKCEAERQNQLMEIQKAQSVKAIEAIKRSEYEISLVRHDMRHFLNNILAYIETENCDKAKDYIKEIIELTDKTAIRKFCNNEIVNMVLSSYESKMNDQDIELKAAVDIPESLPCSDVDLTSILANGLENAIQAVSRLEPDKRFISLALHMNENKLLLSIKNPYAQKPEFESGIPVAREPGHGLGTQSIKYVTSKLKGNCQFTAEDGMFALRVVL